MGNEESRQKLSLDLSEQSLPIIEQITEGMPGGFFIYHADGNEEMIYANMAMVTMCGCDSFEDFKEYCGGSFRGLVHPDDLARVEDSIQSQIRSSDKALDYVEYRIKRKNGAIRWLRDYGRFVHTELYGDVVEQGTHSELMGQKGFYYKLYASQFE